MNCASDFIQNVLTTVLWYHPMTRGMICSCSCTSLDLQLQVYSRRESEFVAHGLLHRQYLLDIVSSKLFRNKYPIFGCNYFFCHQLVLMHEVPRNPPEYSRISTNSTLVGLCFNEVTWENNEKHEFCHMSAIFSWFTPIIPSMYMLSVCTIYSGCDCFLEFTVGVYKLYPSL